MEFRTAETVGALRALGRLEERRSTDLSDAELLDVLRLGTVLRRLGETVQAMGAAEAEARSEEGALGLARRRGFRTAAHLVEQYAGVGSGEAYRLLNVGRMLRTADATVESGEHTPDARVGSGEMAASDAPSGSRELAAPDAGAGHPPTSSLVPASEQALMPPSTPAESAVQGPAPIAPASHRGAREGVYTLVADSHRRGLIDGNASHKISRCLDEVRSLRAALERARAAGGLNAPTHGSAPWTDPERLEIELVRIAQVGRPQQLHKRCLEARAAADPVAWEERERMHHRERYLIISTEDDGVVSLKARLDAASAAPLAAFLDAHVNAGMQNRRNLPTGADTRGAGAMRVDALVDLARHGIGCEQQATGVTTTVMVRVAKSDLERGTGLADCDDLPAPVSVGTLRRLAVDAAVLPAVLGSEGQVLDLGRTRRLFTRAQRLALGERDGGCAICGAAPSWCEAHHIDWWSREGRTDLSNGVLLCTNCHHRVHDGTWDVIQRDGEVYIRPPSSVDPARRLRPAIRRHRHQPGALQPRATAA